MLPSRGCQGLGCMQINYTVSDWMQLVWTLDRNQQHHMKQKLGHIAKAI